MFRVTEDPSSGSLVQCLAKNYKNDQRVRHPCCVYNTPLQFTRIILSCPLTWTISVLWQHILTN